MTQMTPAQIREQAMAMLAQADQQEADETPDGALTADEYRAWLWAQAEVVDDPSAAWTLVSDSWDELDGNETLHLVGLLFPRFSTPVDEAVDYSDGYIDKEALARRAALQALDRMERTTANFSALELHALQAGVPIDVIFEGREMTASTEAAARAHQAEQGTPAEAPVGHPVLAAKLKAVPGIADPIAAAAQVPIENPPADDLPEPPRGMRRRPRADQRQAVPTGDGSQVQLNQPLKTGAPRQRSGHNIPAQHAQYRRGADGRMVPVDQIPDPQ